MTGDHVYFWQGMVFPRTTFDAWSNSLHFRPVLYLRGIIGSGKTSFARAFAASRTDWSFAYFSCRQNNLLADVDAWLRTPRETGEAALLILDDLQLASDPTLHWLMEHVLEDNALLQTLKVLLVSEAKLPEGLTRYRLGRTLQIIDEDDLILGTDVIYELFSRQDAMKHLTPAERLYRAIECHRLTSGYGLAVQSFLSHYVEGNTSYAALKNGIQEDVFAIFNEKWRQPDVAAIADTLVSLSVFTSFTEPMAEALLGHAVNPAVQEFRKTHSILRDCGDALCFAPFVREFLLFHLNAGSELAVRRQLFIDAGRINREHGREWDAFQCFLAAEQHDELMRSVIELCETAHHTAIRKIAKDGIMALFPRAWDADEPRLLGARILIAAIQVKLAECHELIGELYERSLKETTARGDREGLGPNTTVYVRTLFTLPHASLEFLIEGIMLLKAYLSDGNLYKTFTRPVQLPVQDDLIALFPFEWLANPLMQERLTRVLPEDVQNKLRILIGSYYLETGRRCEAIDMVVSALGNPVRSPGLHAKLDGASVLSRIDIAEGRIDKSKANFRAYLEEAEALAYDDACQTIKAGLILADVLENKLDSVQSWILIEEQEYELPAMPIDYFRLFSQTYAYLALGDNRSAYQRIALLDNYVDRMRNSYLYVEQRIMKSIVLERLGEPWQEMLSDAMRFSSRYGLKQLFIDRGAALLPLWLQLTPETRQEQAFHSLVLGGLKQMAALYPHFLSRHVDVRPSIQLSNREADVLRLIIQGKTNTEIAKALYVTTPTVKFHVGNILQKLNAANRTEAAHIAVELGLV